MNKKGFTLVELLGVLVVLSVILMIAFPLITTYINKSKQKAYDTQMGLIITGLKDYATDHKEVLPVNDTDYVTFTLGQLKALGIVNNSVVNPLDGKEIDDSMEFKIVKDGSKYTYQIVESSRLSRDNKNHTPSIILNGNILNYIDLDSTYNELGASATDYDGKPLSVTIDKTDLDVSTIGVYQIRYEVIDSNNTKSYAIRTVIVGESKKIANGTAIYYNVTTGKKCLSSDYSLSQSNTEVKSGCMKFYAFNDDGESDTVNLLLDHNTTAVFDWYTSYNNTKGPSQEFLEQLKADTADWKGTITPKKYTVDQSQQGSKANYTIDYTGFNARLITANELFKISKLTNLDEITLSSENRYSLKTENNWLFDNTYKCNDYGCPRSETHVGAVSYRVYGYWTSTSCANYYAPAWLVDCDGYINSAAVQGRAVRNDYWYGIRPVIEVYRDSIL